MSQANQGTASQLSFSSNLTNFSIPTDTTTSSFGQSSGRNLHLFTSDSNQNMPNATQLPQQNSDVSSQYYPPAQSSSQLTTTMSSNSLSNSSSSIVPNNSTNATKFLNALQHSVSNNDQSLSNSNSNNGSSVQTPLNDATPSFSSVVGFEKSLSPSSSSVASLRHNMPSFANSQLGQTQTQAQAQTGNNSISNLQTGIQNQNVSPSHIKSPSFLGLNSMLNPSLTSSSLSNGHFSTFGLNKPTLPTLNTVNGGTTSSTFNPISRSFNGPLNSSSTPTLSTTTQNQADLFSLSLQNGSTSLFP